MKNHPKSLANKSVRDKLHRSITKYQEANGIKPMHTLGIFKRIFRTIFIKLLNIDIMDRYEN